MKESSTGKIKRGSTTRTSDGKQDGQSDFDTSERLTRSVNRLEQSDVSALESSFHQILESVGEDPRREGLLKTPGRAARAFEFLTQGYRQSIDEIVNNAIYESEASEIILVKDIELYSMCEHHLLPFIGRCHVAYIPQGKVIGLSKVARIVDVFARRFQIQENLTTQVADAVMAALHPLGVAVVIEAKHLCMMMRGVEKQNSIMKTSCLLGCFKEDATTRSEFLALLCSP
jgi:GTP cyclohydrolase I